MTAPAKFPASAAKVTMIVCALGAAVLAGCGGGSTPSGTGTPATRSSGAGTHASPSTGDPNAPTDSNSDSSGDTSGLPCSLLTTADIATVTGKPMAIAGTDGRVTCAYTSADHTQQFAVMIMSDRASMKTLLQIEAGSKHIDGLGDDAFWAGGTILFVRRGDRAFELTSPSILDTQNIDAGLPGMTQLARHALAKF